jgi:hypothetical protein
VSRVASQHTCANQPSMIARASVAIPNPAPWPPYPPPLYPTCAYGSVKGYIHPILVSHLVHHPSDRVHKGDPKGWDGEDDADEVKPSTEGTSILLPHSGGGEWRRVSNLSQAVAPQSGAGCDSLGCILPRHRPPRVRPGFSSPRHPTPEGIRAFRQAAVSARATP